MHASSAEPPSEVADSDGASDAPPAWHGGPSEQPAGQVTTSVPLALEVESDGAESADREASSLAAALLGDALSPDRQEAQRRVWVLEQAALKRWQAIERESLQRQHAIEAGVLDREKGALALTQGIEARALLRLQTGEARAIRRQACSTRGSHAQVPEKSVNSDGEGAGYEGGLGDSEAPVEGRRS